MYRVGEAIIAINPKAQVSINDEGTENEEIIYHHGTPEIPKADIVAMVAKLKADYDNKQYQRDRKKEYDKLNQFELIGEDSINGTTKHRDAIQAIKDKFPKGDN